MRATVTTAAYTPMDAAADATADPRPPTTTAVAAALPLAAATTVPNPPTVDMSVRKPVMLAISASGSCSPISFPNPVTASYVRPIAVTTKSAVELNPENPPVPIFDIAEAAFPMPVAAAAAVAETPLIAPYTSLIGPTIADDADRSMSNRFAPSVASPPVRSNISFDTAAYAERCPMAAATPVLTPSVPTFTSTVAGLTAPAADTAASTPALTPSAPTFTSISGGLIFPAASTAETTPSALPLIATVGEDFSIFSASASTSADAADTSSVSAVMLTRLPA